MDFVLKSRELTDAERDEFKLWYHMGDDKKYPHRYQYEGTSHVWWVPETIAITMPIYRLYYTGTNGLTVLEYRMDTDKWSQIKPEQISNLYGFLWTMISDFNRFPAQGPQ